MLTSYIIDDELHAIKNLQVYIERTPWIQLVGYNQDPVMALSYFNDATIYPDITFLDIDMPQLSGIELSSSLYRKTAIVFTTAHPDFALQAFELDIKDYLLKPFSYERFIKCVSKISELLPKKKSKDNGSGDDFFYIQVEGKGKLIKLFFKEISYIESQKNYISFFTREKKYLTYLTLTEVEQKLPPAFLRVNKSYIIHIEKISHIEGNQIFLLDIKDSFSIGASFKEIFAKHMKDHLIKTNRI